MKRTYIIKEKGTNFYKLGRLLKTARVRTRYRNLQGGNPRVLEILKMYAGDRESELHSIYEAWRYRAEWFIFPPGMVFPAWEEATYSLELERVDTKEIRTWFHPEHGFLDASIHQLTKILKKQGRKPGSSLHHLVREEINTVAGWRLVR